MSQPYYDIGKATLTAGSDIMTGQGTLWIGNARPGDQVVSYSNHTAIVGDVVSNTQIKLKRPYRGTNQAALAYEIMYTPDDPYTQTIARGILHKIAQSALVKLGEVTPAPRQLVRFDQAGNAALSPLSDYMLTLLDDADGPTAYSTLGPIPNAQVRADLAPDKAYRRGNVLGTVAQTGGVPTGALIERGSNANGEYVRWADGTQICWVANLPFSTFEAHLYTASWSFPAAFVSEPAKSATIREMNPWPNSGYLSARPLGGATVHASIQLRSTGLNTSPVLATLTAIAEGRWY